MAKHIIQDIIIKKGAAVKSRPSDISKSFFSKEKPPQKKEKLKIKDYPAKKSKKGKILFLLLVFILSLIMAAKIINGFSRAVIQITPHKETIKIDAILTASRQNSADLKFEIMAFSITKQKTATATGITTVESKASGQIVIYNAFSSAPQSLIENTRFETSDGKIYRIDKRIIVPGATIKDGDTIPGSIESMVYADEAGEQYNIGLSDFTIPGFKNSPRYEKFYARSKTPMSGGFTGERPIISEESGKNINNELEKIVAEELTAKANMQKPDNFILYPEAVKITFEEDAENLLAETETNKFTIKKTGNFSAFLISRNDLSQLLVKKYLSEEYQNKVRVTNLEELKFELISREDKNQSMKFKISGEAVFVWIIDEEALKNSLIASPGNLEEIFKSYPAVERAFIVFKPSWWKFFPKKTSKITIKQML